MKTIYYNSWFYGLNNWMAAKYEAGLINID